MADIVLKNRDGTPATYEGVSVLKLQRAEQTKETLFAEQTVEFFDLTEDGMPGVWATDEFELSALFAVGDTVTVKIDDAEYTCTAYEAEGVTLVGNVAIAGTGEDTGEPFVIGAREYNSDIVGVVETTLSGDSHVLAISKASGGGSSLVPFTYGELVEDAQISLDFSGGNQQISVPDGSLVKAATILKPDTLVPENIKQGVDIAGITGTHEGGGGGGTVTFTEKTGEFTASTSGVQTITHNLGVAPKIIFVYASPGASLGSGGIDWVIGYSESVIAKQMSNTTNYQLSSERGIETDRVSDWDGFIANATPTTFEVGGSALAQINAGVEYNWQVLG